MIWKSSGAAFSSLFVTFLLACLPLMASGDTEPAEPVVGEQAQQELTVTPENADGWKAIEVCFECHDMSEKGISLQPRKPQKKHREVMAKQRPCTDCHNKTNILCCHDNLFQN